MAANAAASRVCETSETRETDSGLEGASGLASRTGLFAVLAAAALGSDFLVVTEVLVLAGSVFAETFDSDLSVAPADVLTDLADFAVAAFSGREALAGALSIDLPVTTPVPALARPAVSALVAAAATLLPALAALERAAVVLATGVWGFAVFFIALAMRLKPVKLSFLSRLLPGRDVCGLCLVRSIRDLAVFKLSAAA